MNITLCDICGWRTAAGWLGLSNEDRADKKKLDVCDECRAQFWQWIENVKGKVREEVMIKVMAINEPEQLDIRLGKQFQGDD